MHRLMRWWPPYLRTEIVLLRASVRQANAAYAKCRDALNRETEAHMRTRAELDRERSSAVGFGMARPLDQPMPWQVADAIAQDVEAKRNEDI